MFVDINFNFIWGKFFNTYILTKSKSVIEEAISSFLIKKILLFLNFSNLEFTKSISVFEYVFYFKILNNKKL